MAEKPARRDSIPNSPRKNSIETMTMMISVLRRIETNIQCVYCGYMQLEIRYLVSFVFELQVRIVVSTI